jgi:hypothetical protein
MKLYLAKESRLWIQSLNATMCRYRCVVGLLYLTSYVFVNNNPFFFLLNISSLYIFVSKHSNKSPVCRTSSHMYRVHLPFSHSLIPLSFQVPALNHVNPLFSFSVQQSMCVSLTHSSSISRESEIWTRTCPLYRNLFSLINVLIK